MIALPMLLTNVLFASTAEVNSMLKLRFAIAGMMTSSLPKFGNLTSSSEIITFSTSYKLFGKYIESDLLSDHSYWRKNNF